MLKIEREGTRTPFFENIRVNSAFNGNDTYLDSFYLVKDKKLEVRIALSGLKKNEPNAYLVSERISNGSIGIDIFREPNTVGDMIDSYLNLVESGSKIFLSGGLFNYKSDINFIDKEIEIGREINSYDCNDIASELLSYSGLPVRNIKKGYVEDKLTRFKDIIELI